MRSAVVAARAVLLVCCSAVALGARAGDRAVRRSARLEHRGVCRRRGRRRRVSGAARAGLAAQPRPRHQRPDARRGRRRHVSRRMGRSRDRRLPVRDRAVARVAQHGSRARSDSRADGSDAGRGAHPAWRSRRDRAGRPRRDRRGDDRSVPARRFRSTARWSRADPTSIRRRSPASRCPSTRAPGDEVFAGTINGHGALEVTVTRKGRDTTLARIIHLVETAQAQRAPVAAVHRSLRALVHARGDRPGRVDRHRAAAASARHSRPGSTARWCCSSSRARARS